MFVRVLGPVELIDGAAAVRLAPVERTLLAALASRSGERVAVDVLEEALWPDHPPASAHKTLQGHIMRLRKVLGAPAIGLLNGGYRLDPGYVEVDAGRIAPLVAAAREAIRAGRPGDGVAPLREARGAFRGDPYADVPDCALPAGEVARLQELRSVVIEEGFEAELACGNGQACIGDLEAFVGRNPYRERAWGQLMRGLYQAGRPADALAAYGRARLVLVELGLEPGPALHDLERAILNHDRSLLGTDAATASLGPANLPAELNPIIGRGRELAALAELAAEHRLLTLTGTGGIGKTRLAVELAARTGRTHEHGPYFAGLAAIGDVGLVPAALAATLGVEVDAHEDPAERVRDALAGRQLTVVIDNCEHLLPGIAALIAAVLASAPGLRIVATSREPLDISGERVWPVEPLGVPPETSSLDQILESDSGALFLASLPMNVTARSLNAEDVVAIGAVCRSLEGIPLGLELAAARTRTLSLPDLADRLGHSIRELAAPRHGVVLRHRTMRAALDWGFQLLSPTAQTALRAMSVFAGGCELSAFAAVCVDGDGEPADVMDELVRTSFVTVDFSTTPTRHRLLEPVRQYAGELLDTSGERDDRQQRHLQFYGDLAEALNGEEDQPGGHIPLAQLGIELGNLRAAMDWAVARPSRAEAGLRLAANLYHVWTGRAHHAEGVARIVGLLGSGAGSPAARSTAARTAAIVAAHMGEHDQARVLCAQALDEVGGDPDGPEARRARQVLAQILMARGDVVAARRCLAPALPTGAQQVSDVDAFCLLSQVEIDLAAGDLDAAAAGAERVVDGSFGSFSWIGTAARFLLAVTMLERGDLTGSRSWLDRSLALGEQLGDPVAVIEAHLQLVAVECAEGRIDDAWSHLREAAVIRQDAHRRGDLPFLQARSMLALADGSASEALALSEKALALAIDVMNAHDRLGCLRFLGDAHLAAGDPASALRAYEQLVAVAGAGRYPFRVAEAHEGAAAAASTVGEQGLARRHLAAARDIRLRTGTRRLRRPVVEELLVRLESEPDLDE